MKKNIFLLKKKIKNEKALICVIGLGYVGLPVAAAFSRKFKVIGYDINQSRIRELKSGLDINCSLIKNDIKNLKKILFTYKRSDIKDCDIFIITTPTPILKNNKPDLSFVIKALEIFKTIDIKNKLIILESTVFPDASKDKFIPFLEKISQKKINVDFYYGYSPERINPGDNKNNIYNIDKIVAGSDIQVASIVSILYSSVIKKVHTASTISVAEMSKVIENIQRDINIALINEISLICKKFNLNTHEVLKLSATKWNFLKFEPGLVGGHCIGVDPYYLIHKMIEKKFNPRIILAGRAINEGYPVKLCKFFISHFKEKKVKKIIFFGVTYKKNCNDIRNSKSFEMIEYFRKNKYKLDIFDPYYKSFDLNKKNKFSFLSKFPIKNYDAAIISVDHDYFKKIGSEKIKKIINYKDLIFDIKNIFPKENFIKT
jgi:UDP-N-acetyl-D-galactosamine dehydrogenase